MEGHLELDHTVRTPARWLEVEVLDPLQPSRKLRCHATGRVVLAHGRHGAPSTLRRIVLENEKSKVGIVRCRAGRAILITASDLVGKIQRHPVRNSVDVDVDVHRFSTRPEGIADEFVVDGISALEDAVGVVTKSGDVILTGHLRRAATAGREARERGAPDVAAVLGEATAQPAQVEVVESAIHIELESVGLWNAPTGIDAEKLVREEKIAMEDRRVEDRERVLDFLSERSAGSALPSDLVGDAGANFNRLEWTRR